MGQCLSFAKPLIDEVIEEVLKPADGAAASGNEGGPKVYDVNSSSPPQDQSSPSPPPAVSPPPTSWANVVGKPTDDNTTAAVAPQPAIVSVVFPSSSDQHRSGAIHESLPNDAEQHTVRNVYDGDTLTLTDERRVRLLGIDTPEIKENQPYAQEAKAYTKDRCNKEDIWLSFEPNGEREDHYGRLLCFVWVRSNDGGDGYLCINEGIVESGFAKAYHPGKGDKLKNWEKLVELQSEARKAKRGVWTDFEDFKVVKTANGSAYHKRSCEHLSSVRNLTEMMASEAAEKGLHPCRTCLS